MKKIMVLLCLMGLYVAQGNACTNFIVGKKASTDGSVICSYNADDYGMFQYLCLYPWKSRARLTPEGKRR